MALVTWQYATFNEIILPDGSHRDQVQVFVTGDNASNRLYLTSVRVLSYAAHPVTFHVTSAGGNLDQVFSASPNAGPVPAVTDTPSDTTIAIPANRVHIVSNGDGTFGITDFVSLSLSAS